jgi:hypothetical protein
MGAKRKTQMFIGKDGQQIHVLKKHVDTIFRMATDGDFSKLETDVGPQHVNFKYVTNYGVGEITLLGVRQ